MIKYSLSSLTFTFINLADVCIHVKTLYLSLSVFPGNHEFLLEVRILYVSLSLLLYRNLHHPRKLSRQPMLLPLPVWWPVVPQLHQRGQGGWLSLVCHYSWLWKGPTLGLLPSEEWVNPADAAHVTHRTDLLNSEHSFTVWKLECETTVHHRAHLPAH